MTDKTLREAILETVIDGIMKGHTEIERTESMLGTLRDFTLSDALIETIEAEAQAPTDDSVQGRWRFMTQAAINEQQS
jgi:hypothetical protein